MEVQFTVGDDWEANQKFGIIKVDNTLLSQISSDLLENNVREIKINLRKLSMT